MLISRRNFNRAIVYTFCSVSLVSVFFALWRSKPSIRGYPLHHNYLRAGSEYWYSNHEIVYWNWDQTPPQLTLQDITTWKSTTFTPVSKAMEYDARAFYISPNRRQILSRKLDTSLTSMVIDWQGTHKEVWSNLDNNRVGMFWALDSQSWVEVIPVSSSTDETQRHPKVYDVVAHDLGTKAVQKTRIYLEQKNQYSWMQIPSFHSLVFVQEVALYNTRTEPLELYILTFQKHTHSLQKQKFIIPNELNVLSLHVSPNGKSILWVLSPYPAITGLRNPQMTLWIGNLKSEELHFVTTLPDQEYDATQRNWNTAWLPDGHHISFTNNNTLYVMSSRYAK